MILNKIIEYFKLKKLTNIPVKRKDGKWDIVVEDFITHKKFIYTSDTLGVFEHYTKNSLVYYFKIKGLGISHGHSFNEVIEKVYEFPESFKLDKECKSYYTERQLSFIKSLQAKLLEDGFKDIGVYYKKHPSKSDNVANYLEYNEEELKKRQIKIRK